MRALRSLLFVLLVLPLAQPAAYDGEEDGGQNAEFSVDRSSESGRPTTSRPNTSLKGDYDHEYSNERASGSSKSAEATTAASSPAARTTPTSSASYEVNLDSSESSTQYPAWVGKSSEERRTKGGVDGSNTKQQLSTISPAYDDTPASSPLPKAPAKQQPSLSFAPYNVPRGSTAAKEARARFSKRPPVSLRPNSIGQHRRPSSTSQAAAYPQRAPVSSVAPSLRHAAGRTSALPSLRRQPPAAALPQPAAQHSQGRYQFAKMNGGPPPQAAGYAPARRQGPGAYSWAKMPFSGRQQPGRMGGGYQTKSPVAAPRSSPAAYRPALPVHQQPRGYARPSGGSALPQRAQSYSMPRAQALQSNRPAVNYAQHPQHSIRSQPSSVSPHSAHLQPSAYQQRPQAVARPQARSFAQPRPQPPNSPASRRPAGYGRRPVNGEYSMRARPVHTNRQPPPQPRVQPARPSAYNRRPPSTNLQPAGSPMGAGSSRVSHNRGQSARVATLPAFRTRRPPTTPAPQSNGRPARPWTMKLSTATVASAENLGVNPSGYKYGI